MKTWAFSLLFCCLLGTIWGQSILTSKHNLSTSGPGTVKATTETEICIFCHTMHNSDPSTPLWNRARNVNTYQIYTSSTLKSVPGQPTGSSLLCLSCHDGTVALGSVLNRADVISFASGLTMPVGRTNLGTDLRNDHPVSFTYDGNLSSTNPNLKNPSTLPSKIKLENGQLQCMSCHDPHSSSYSSLLVQTSQNSTLCISCHQEPNWTNAVHNTSTKTWNGVAPNPWPYTPWTTVSQNACESCHNPHNAGSTTRLLQYATEEDNCLNCHNTHVDSKDLQTQFTKTYKHNVYGYTGIHDPTEATLVATKHVECVDCHNAHTTIPTTATTAPLIKGANTGVAGISQNGTVVNPAVNEYEICYRCHSSNPPTGVASPRNVVQSDLRLEFDPAAPSYHPVAAVGKNPTIGGLISPYTASSQIYCTDCHASDGAGSPAGPHGSIYPQILKYNYDRTSDYVNSYAAYQLCYQCHDQTTTITFHNAFSPSATHGTLTSCNNCHDPHGVNAAQGTALNNSHMMNFNTNVVTANANGILNWTWTSPGHGTCNLNCHATGVRAAHDHVNSSY